jgi:hypothetical protein
MADGIQTVYRTFVTGPAQRPDENRRDRIYPTLESVTGPTQASADFARRVTAGDTLEKLAAAFALRVAKAEGELSTATIGARAPLVMQTLRLLDDGQWTEAAASVDESSDQVKWFSERADHLHAAVLGYVAAGRSSAIGERAIKLMKLLWIARQSVAVKDRSPDSEHVAFVREFWSVGTIRVQLTLPRSEQDPWAAAGPAARRAANAKAQSVAQPQTPSFSDLQTARREIDYLARAQQVRAPKSLPVPTPTNNEFLSGPLGTSPRNEGAESSRVAKPDGTSAQAPIVHRPPIEDPLDDASRKLLSANTLAVVERLGFSAERHPPDALIHGIDLATAHHWADGGTKQHIPVIIIGDIMLRIDPELFPDPSCDEPDLPCHCDLLVELDAKHGATPRLHILGTGKAYRIDQTHERYLPGQLVHTENHEQGAQREMKFRRLDRAEQTDETETESETFREAETTTHDQFEMSKEIAKAAQQQQDTSAGVSVTASYGAGPVSAALAGHFDTSSSTAAQTSEKIATASAKEIISKAVEQTKQKSRQLRIVKSLTETERTESLVLDNRGSPSRTDFYRAIDQEYRNQLVCVGERLMVRMTLQEPMAYLLWVLAKRSAEGVVLEKPTPPSIQKFDDITTVTYGSLCAAYGASGVRPPPGAIVVSDHIDHPYSAGEPPWLDASGTIALPEGWQASTASCNMLRTNGGAYYISVAIGTGGATFYSGGLSSWALSGETGQVGWALRGHDSEYAATFTINCVPTPQAIQKWKIEVFEAIMSAYRAKKEAYDAQVAAARFSSAVGIDERNPALNRIMVEQELQKFLLGATLPAAYFRGFDSMKFSIDCDASDGTTIAEPDFEDAWRETPWVTFLSQLYEWKNMTYQFLPYLYGHRDHWRRLRSLTSNDPYFQNAITAGSVVVDVPVAPHMAQAFLYYLSTGQIWSGGDMPVIGDPAYQDLAIAIRDSELKDGQATGAPWFTVVPTSLVYFSPQPPVL